LRIFKTKAFARFQRKEGIDDDALRDAGGIEIMVRGRELMEARVDEDEG
jgi:hypothetical protein